MNADQLRECPFCNGDGELDIDENHNHFVSCIECRAEGSRAACASDAANAWNTRPAAVASHAEGEAVACWSLAHKDGGGPLFADCIYDNREDAQLDADALNGEHGDLVPVPLYPHPPRSGNEARDAARYRWLRAKDNDVFVIWPADDDAWVPHTDDLDKSIDAAMAARGEERETGR